MTLWLPQGVASPILLGPFLDVADGVTPLTGLTLLRADIQLSKNSSVYAQSANVSGGTHRGLGDYSATLAASDLSELGRLRVHVNKSGACPVWQDYQVLPAQIYNWIGLGSEYLYTRPAGGIIGPVFAVESQTSLLLSTGDGLSSVFTNNAVMIYSGAGEANVRKVVSFDTIDQRLTLDSACDFTVAIGDTVVILSTLDPKYLVQLALTAQGLSTGVVSGLQTPKNLNLSSG